LAVHEPGARIPGVLGGADGVEEDRHVLGQEGRADLHRSASIPATVSASERTSPHPTRTISSAGSCRCGSVVPVHSSTTIGLKSRNLASFEVAATPWVVSPPVIRH